MKKIDLVNAERECCGCGACIAACPKKAIRMEENEYGFLYPIIDENMCIMCGICKKVCNYQKTKPVVSLKETYVSVSENTELLESASGGVFASLAQVVLDVGGVVYGCALLYEEGKLNPRHICVDNKKELIKLKGSKYIQSDMKDIYSDIEWKLKSGKKVLFSGTPCQVSALNGYLGKKYDNLFSVDIICHGVPSVKFFHDYIEFLERKKGKKVIDFKFRDKHGGWGLAAKVTYQDKSGIITSEYLNPEESSYYQMFLDSYTYRENCYSCPFASDFRSGDITIGDYWCIDLVHPEILEENQDRIDEKKGVSCVIINNSQGQVLLNEYGKGLALWKSTYDNASKYNGQLIRSSLLKSERNKVFSLYADGYGKVEKWYQRRLAVIKFKRSIIALVPKGVKDVLRPMLKR